MDDDALISAGCQLDCAGSRGMRRSRIDSWKKASGFILWTTQNKREGLISVSAVTHSGKKTNKQQQQNNGFRQLSIELNLPKKTNTYLYPPIFGPDTCIYVHVRRQRLRMPGLLYDCNGHPGNGQYGLIDRVSGPFTHRLATCDLTTGNSKIFTCYLP